MGREDEFCIFGSMLWFNMVCAKRVYALFVVGKKGFMFYFCFFLGGFERWWEQGVGFAQALFVFFFFLWGVEDVLSSEVFLYSFSTHFSSSSFW